MVRDGWRAVIDFGDSRCELTAAVGRLDVTIMTAEAAELPELEAVVAEHVRRVAGDEVLQIDWSRKS